MITRINMNNSIPSQNTNFKGYVPLRIYVKDEISKRYYPLSDEKSLKNCGGQLPAAGRSFRRGNDAGA